MDRRAGSTFFTVAVVDQSFSPSNLILTLSPGSRSGKECAQCRRLKLEEYFRFAVLSASLYLYDSATLDGAFFRVPVDSSSCVYMRTSCAGLTPVAETGVER